MAYISRLLTATAFGQCDSEFGQPRLCLIEAVVALEITIKDLMQHRLKVYGMGPKQIDRVVRDTPMADLVTVWIRREIPPESIADETYLRCKQAIIERNELVHLNRRSIDPERTRGHVLAIATIVSEARKIVGKDGLRL